MAFPAIAGTVTVTNGTSAVTDPVCNLPASITAGETLVLYVRIGSGGTLATPSGWSNLLAPVLTPNGTTPDRQAIFYKKATGSEGATVTITGSISSRFAAISWRVSGATDPTVVPPSISAVASGSSVNPNAASLAPSGGAREYLWATVQSNESEGSTTGTPTNYGTRTDANSGTTGAVDTNVRMSMASRTNSAASEDAGNWTISTAPWVAYTIAFWPATGATITGTAVGASANAPAYALAAPRPFKNRLGVSGESAGQNGTTVSLDADTYDFNTAMDDWGGFQFKNIPIGKGDTILGAHWLLIPFKNDDADINIYAEDVGEATNFTTDASNISNRTRTTASVTWTETNINLETGDSLLYASPDIKTVLQEVVDRSDWNWGNDINLIVESRSTTSLLILTNPGDVGSTWLRVWKQVHATASGAGHSDGVAAGRLTSSHGTARSSGVAFGDGAFGEGNFGDGLQGEGFATGTGSAPGGGEVFGTAAGAATGSGTSAATVEHLATAAGAATGSGTSAATVEHLATAAGAGTGSGTATGTVSSGSGEVFGTAAGSGTSQGTAVAVKSVAGTAVAFGLGAGAIAGQVSHLATAAGAGAGSGTAVAKRTVFGQSVGSGLGAGSAVGGPTKFGQGVGSGFGTGSAVGAPITPKFGTASGSGLGAGAAIGGGFTPEFIITESLPVVTVLLEDEEDILDTGGIIEVYERA